MTPEQKARVLQFTNDSLKVAVDSGALKPGYSVLIGSGVGIITNLSIPNAAPKEVPLADLGLESLVASGAVKPGETVVIQEKNALIVTPATAPIIP